MKNMELKRRFQNKYSIRMAAGVLTVAMLGTGSGMVYTVHAQKGDSGPKETQNNKADKKEIKETLEKVLSASKEEEDAGKEETVYVVSNADGSAKNVIVSEWLKNKD